jgi:hypothetical protein
MIPHRQTQRRTYLSGKLLRHRVSKKSCSLIQKKVHVRAFGDGRFIKLSKHPAPGFNQNKD